MSTTLFVFFFFNDTATTEIYTLSLHDALPISSSISWSTTPRTSTPGSWNRRRHAPTPSATGTCGAMAKDRPSRDRKSTRLNSSHLVISYAVFCLKKKKENSSLYTATQYAPY